MTNKCGSELEALFLSQCIDAGVAPSHQQYRAIPARRFLWDFAWENQRVLVEIQGGTYLRRSAHTSPLGVRRDAIKNNLAIIYGWRPFQFTADLVRNGVALEVIKAYLSGDETYATKCLTPKPIKANRAPRRKRGPRISS